MKKNLFLAFAIVCSLSMWAHPTTMYMIGDATDAGWTLEAQPMTTMGDGVYLWHGDLKTGSLKFAKDGADYGVPADFWGATVDGAELSTTSGTVDIENLENGDKKFDVKEAGEYYLTLDLSANTLTVGLRNSASGHTLYFKKPASWAKAYLRIGRQDHVSAIELTQMGDTEWWSCPSPDYANFYAWTFTDSDDQTAPVTKCPADANRLYFFTFAIDQDFGYVVDGTEKAGTDEFGAHFWANHSVDAPTAIDNVNIHTDVVKRMVNGQLVIIRDGKTFNATGAEVR